MYRILKKGKYVIVNGMNAATATALETICGRSALITPGTATAMQVSSTSANDVNTSGTGAWKVMLYGLNSTFQEVSEEFNLNGQTAVTGSVTMLRVNEMAITAVGTGLANAGEVIASRTGAALTAGVPNTATDVVSSIVVGANLSQQALYTVKAEDQLSLVKVHLSNRSQIDRAYLNVRKPGSTIWYTAQQWELSATGTEEFEFPTGALVFRGGTDLRFDCYAGTAGGFIAVTAVFEVL